MFSTRRFIEIERNFQKISTQLIDQQRRFTLIDEYGTHGSGQLIELSRNLSRQIESVLKSESSRKRPWRIGVLCPNNYTYLSSILAAWFCHATPVTLNRSHPSKLIDFYLNDSECDLLIKSKHDDSYAPSRKIPQLEIDASKFYTQFGTPSNKDISLREILKIENNPNEALILYTSGTSSRPKGAVLSHSNLHASLENLNYCWRLASDDVVLNSLPLNHIHGLAYCLLAPIFQNATCILLPKFEPKTVWDHLLSPNQKKVSIFSGVPTIYFKLLEEAENMKYDKYEIKEKLRRFKLFATASAPLNPKISDRWFQLTGFRLLDRYGLTETSGLVLGNRVDSNVIGTVGGPAFNFDIRLVSPTGEKLVEATLKKSRVFANSQGKRDDKKREDLIGELEVRGPGMFQRYLNQPELTRNAYTHDGWFKTGDTAEYVAEKRAFKIVGRTSVDVIKSGGVKLSALEIEAWILEHDLVEDVAVLGIEDDKWGQVVMAILVVRDDFQLDGFLEWCRKRMSAASVPKLVECVEKIERNQMGKIDKKSLVQKYSKK